MSYRVLALCLLAAGCGPVVSSMPVGHVTATGTPVGGIPYALPRGVVPIQVFADKDGVGVTIEPAQLVGDPSAGQLVASLHPSPFNKENIQLAVNPASGFLSTISSESEARILTIIAEAAKTAGRLALESGRASFLESRVTLLQDSFDPLSPADVERINRAVSAAVGRGMLAWPVPGGRNRVARASFVRLSVVNPDGSQPPTAAPPRLDGCQVGICVRAMTTRLIRADVDGGSFSKAVAIPDAAVVPVPVPQTILADQTLGITVEDGILKGYNLKRDSELLGLVKIPGTILDGLVAGAVQSLTDSKSVLDAQKAEADSAKAAKDAKAAATAAVKLESDAAGGAAAAYVAQTLTFYTYPATLTTAIRARIDAEKARPRARLPDPGQANTADLLDGRPPAPSPAPRPAAP